METILLLLFGAPLFAYDMFLRNASATVGRHLAHKTGRTDLQSEIMPWWQPMGVAILWFCLFMNFVQTTLDGGLLDALYWIGLFLFFVGVMIALLLYLGSRHYLEIIRNDLQRRADIYGQYGRHEQQRKLLLIIEHFTVEFLPDAGDLQAEAG